MDIAKWMCENSSRKATYSAFTHNLYLYPPTLAILMIHADVRIKPSFS